MKVLNKQSEQTLGQFWIITVLRFKANAHFFLKYQSVIDSNEPPFLAHLENEIQVHLVSLVIMNYLTFGWRICSKKHFCCKYNSNLRFLKLWDLKMFLATWTGRVACWLHVGFQCRILSNWYVLLSYFHSYTFHKWLTHCVSQPTNQSFEWPIKWSNDWLIIQSTN